MSPGPEDLISQAEKRSILENDKRVRDQAATYMSHTHDDLELGGRFAKQTPQTIVGSTPAPDYPPGPTWCAGDQGIEPALGVDINEMQPTGEAHEVQASLATQDAPSPGHLPFSAQGNSGDPSVAPPNNPLIGVEQRGGSPPFPTEEE